VSNDDTGDLETIEPVPVIDSNRPSVRPSGLSRWIVLAVSGVLVALAVLLIITAVQLSDLRGRVDRLEHVPATTTTVPVVSAEYQFCLSDPLAGDITYRTDTGTISGDVGGFPPSSDVQMELWDNDRTPARIVARKIFTTNANGAAHFGIPSFGRSVPPVTQIFFRVRIGDREAQLFGPPAYPC
jgi:hypothetical protein